MVNMRIRMGKIKEIIRLYEAGLSIRKIAAALFVSRPVASIIELFPVPGPAKIQVCFVGSCFKILKCKYILKIYQYRI